MLPPAPQVEKVVPEPTLRAQGAATRSNKRPLLLAGVVSVFLLLLVGGSAVALLGSGDEKIEIASDVYARVPEGWAVANSSDYGGVGLVPKGYENQDVNDLEESSETSEALSEKAAISTTEDKKCNSSQVSSSQDGSSRMESVATGYDTMTTASDSMENGGATVAGFPATWDVSYAANTLPWAMPNSNKLSNIVAANYPNYLNFLTLDVCVKDLNLRVSMYSSAALAESSSKAPEDEPTSTRNAAVPEAREEVHEDLRQRYEANVAAVTELLESVDTTGWDGSTDLSSIPTSLDSIDEELSDPFKGQLEELATAPEEPDDSGTTESTTPETTTPSSTQSNLDEEALEEFGRKYDEANRGGDWEETYAMLDEGSQRQFTEEEWAEKQQALRDADGPLSPLQSVSVDLPEGVSDTSGNVILYYQDGTSDTLVAGIPMTVTSEEDAGEPKRTLTEEEISYLEQVSTYAGGAETTESEPTASSGDLAAEAEEAAGDYYRASGVENWDYTYDALDSETQSRFTREEWSQKNQWFADQGETIYNIESVCQVGTNDEYFAVTLKLTGEDGSSSTRETYFVLEGEEWKHRFSQEETDLFGPGVPFDEWVDGQGDPSAGDEQYQNTPSQDELFPEDTNGDEGEGI